MLESEDPGVINEKAEALQTAFHAISEAMYQRAQEQAAAADARAQRRLGGRRRRSSEEEEVVDAEVVDEPKA